MESVYSKKVKAGKRRTYFFDVRKTRTSDYYVVITESLKRMDDSGYDRHKIFLYKEDFNKFVKGLVETTDYVKTELMPNFDFDAFSHDNPPIQEPVQEEVLVQQVSEPLVEDSSATNTGVNTSEDVDKW